MPSCTETCRRSAASQRAPGAQCRGHTNEVAIGSNALAAGRWEFFGSFGDRVGSFAVTTARLLLFILLGLIAVALLRHPVERIAAKAASDPIRSTLVGLLAEILFVPVLLVTIFALVVSIVGIPLLVLVPFAVVLLGLVMLVGFTGPRIRPEHRAPSFRTRRSNLTGGGRGHGVIAAVTLFAKLVSMVGRVLHMGTVYLRSAT